MKKTRADRPLPTDSRFSILHSHSAFEISVAYSFTQTFFASVKNSSDETPPSRPTPLSRMPPKGTRRSRRSQQLIQTVPLSMAAATRWARWRSRVQTEQERPYFVEFAKAIA